RYARRSTMFRSYHDRCSSLRRVRVLTRQSRPDRCATRWEYEGMPRENGSQNASGFVCPRCGGALWEHQGTEGKMFECRIGDTFSALELWLEHCDARNRALLSAARSLAENAALARRLVDWARARGDEQMASRLGAEATSDGP